MGNQPPDAARDPDELELFGADVFRRSTTQFQPEPVPERAIVSAPATCWCWSSSPATSSSCTRSSVRFREGRGLDYDIDAVGGFTSNADEDRVSARFANGEISTKIERFLWFDCNPEPAPGSTVHVPIEDPAERIDFPAVLVHVAQVTAALVTIVLVASRLRGLRRPAQLQQVLGGVDHRSGDSLGDVDS